MYLNGVKQCREEVRSGFSGKELFSSVSTGDRTGRHRDHVGTQSLARWTKVPVRNQATGNLGLQPRGQVALIQSQGPR